MINFYVRIPRRESINEDVKREILGGFIDHASKSGIVVTNEDGLDTIDMDATPHVFGLTARFKKRAGFGDPTSDELAEVLTSSVREEAEISHFRFNGVSVDDGERPCLVID